MRNVIRKIDVYLLIKVLFILIACTLIVIVRADYHQMSMRDRLDESVRYFTPLVFDFIEIRLLSFSVLFAACFDIKDAVKKRLHLNKKLFIASMIILVLSLIDYYKLIWNDSTGQGMYDFLHTLGWYDSGSTIKCMWYLESIRYLTLVTSALAGYICCRSFKTDADR